MSVLIRKPIIAIAFCALAFTSCSRMTGSRLRDIDTYVGERPDSALAHLEGMRPRLPWHKAHHALLTSIALDKSYIDIADDSIARVAVDWYDSHGPADRRMKAWYYLGRVQMHARNTQAAIVSLEQARGDAEAMGDKHYLGLIENNMADAYYLNLDAFHAIEHNVRAIQAFDDAGEKLYSDYAKVSLAICYNLAQQNEKCESILLEILKNEADSSLLVSEAALVYAPCLMELSPNNASKAIKYYSLFRDIQKRDVSASELFNMARAWHLIHQEDSASACLTRALQQMRTPFDTVRYYDLLYKEAKERFDYQEANRYMERMVQMQDSVVYKALHHSISTSLGEHFRQEVREHAYKIKERNYLLLLCALVFLLIAVVFLSVDRKRQVKMAQAIISHRQLEEQIRSKEGAVVSLISGRIELLTRLLEQYEQLQRQDIEGASHFDRMESAQEKVRTFQHAIEAMRKDTAFIKGLEEGLNAGKDQIMSRLRNRYGKKLSEQDYQMLSLLFAGIDGPGVSYVTGIKLATIRVKKHRFKERFAKLPDGPDRTLFLREIG